MYRKIFSETIKGLTNMPGNDYFALRCTYVNHVN